MASTLRGFGLEAGNANRIADVLAQTSAASNTNITGLGESMKYVAPVASGLGISVEQVSAMLGVMGNAGIKGSQAGTALRAAMTRLSKEPKAVANALAELGIKARDAQGNFREMPELMQALSVKLKDMGSADQMKYLSNIFGTEAAAGMLAVMKASVDGSLQELEKLNRESGGQLQALSEHIGVSMDEMRAGMENAEPLARKLGISFKDLSVYTAMLAQNGIKGAKADKILTATFKRLDKNSRDVQKGMKAFGLTMYDKNGRMRNFTTVLTELNMAMADMKPPEQLEALTKIFGKDEAKYIQSFMEGLNKGTHKKLDTVATNAKGVSYEMMQKNLETFSGQWAITQSAFSDLNVQIGNALLPEATKLVEVIGKIVSGIVKIMEEHEDLSNAVIKSLGAIAAFKITQKVYKLGGAILELPKAWLEVHNATREAATLAGTVTSAVGGASGSVSNLKSLISALLEPLWLVAAVVALIAMNWEDVCAWCEKAGQAIKNIDRTTPMSELRKSNPADYHIRAMESAYAIPEIGKNAMGGIITSPTVSWVGEAGREAIIPLENQARGTALWIEAGRELGLISESNAGKTIQEYNFVPSIINALQLQPEINALGTPEIKNIIPHATGGIFSQPHIGLVAEAGREAVIPLEDKARGIPLWQAAGEEMGLRFGSITNNNDNSSSNSNVTVSPTFNITVNGGDEQSGNKIRGIIEDILLEIQNDGMRRSFA